MNKLALNNDFSPSEVQIIFLIRKLRLFDKVEIKYAKKGELMWQTTNTDRGCVPFDPEN